MFMIVQRKDLKAVYENVDIYHIYKDYLLHVRWWREIQRDQLNKQCAKTPYTNTVKQIHLVLGIVFLVFFLAYVGEQKRG